VQAPPREQPAAAHRRWAPLGRTFESSLIENALTLQLSALQRQGITVTRELLARPKARVDKHRVLQILINLLTNARSAMSEEPEAGCRGGW